MRTLGVTLLALANMSCAPCFAFEDALEWVDEGWWSGFERERLQIRISRDVDINTASVDELLDVPGMDLATAQHILAARPFDAETWATFAAQYAVPDALRELSLFERKVSPASGEVDWRSGFLRSNFHDRTTSRAGDYAYSKWRARFDLPGTHAAGAGWLISRRPRTEAQYDIGRGTLASEGPRQQWDNDAAYIYGNYAHWRFVAGHFVAGFGENLTFGREIARHSDGFAISDQVQADLRNSRMRFIKDLRGVAAQAQLTEDMSGTVLWSSRWHDLYQYDLRYGPDAWSQPLLKSCAKPGATSRQFTCGDDGRWYTTDVESGAVQYQILRDAYREDVRAAHLAWRSSAWRVGVTAYQAAVTFGGDLPDPRFAPAARSLAGGEAAGFDFLWEDGERRVAGEVAVATKDVAAVARGIWQWGARASTELSVRYFGADFRDPQSHAEAAGDMAEGYTRRNEAGTRLAMRLHGRDWDIDVGNDLWFAPFRRDTSRAWRYTSPRPRDRATVNVQTRWVPFTFFTRAYLQYAVPDAEMDSEPPTPRAGLRVGTLAHWPGNWRAGGDYRVIARREAGTWKNYQHAQLRAGYQSWEGWVDVADAPPPGDPRAQWRGSWRFVWGARVRGDVQAGAFLSDTAPRWRLVWALTWEIGF